MSSLAFFLFHQGKLKEKLGELEGMRKNKIYLE